MSEYSVSRDPSPDPPVTSQGSPRPAKRKKLSTACDACQKRNSRCEMMTPSGCHRCRILGTACSRASSDATVITAFTSGNSPMPMATPGFGASVDGAAPARASDAGMTVLEDIQRRTKRIESLISGLVRRRLNTGVGRMPQAAGLQEREPAAGDASSRQGPNAQPEELLGADSSVAALANKALCVPRPMEFQDPIRNGLVSMDEWSRVYHSFRQSIDRIIPLSFLLPELPTKDALLRTCILLYSVNLGQPDNHTPAYGNRLLSHVGASLDRLAFIPPSQHSVLALLVLSLSPPSVSDRTAYVVPDRFDIARRAVDMGRSLCLDEAEERTRSADPVDLSKEWMQQDIQDTLLWRAVQHRARWVQMLNAQHLLVEPAGSTLPLPQTLCDMQLPLAVHLSHEAHLLDLLSGVLAAYRAIRVSTQYDPAHLDDLILAVETYAAETSIWRDRLASSSRTVPSLTTLMLMHHLFDILLYLQLSSHGNLPSPLGFEIISRLPRYANRILVSSIEALNVLLENANPHLSRHDSGGPCTHPNSHIVPKNDDTSTLVPSLPAFTFQLVLLAYKAVVQARKFDSELSDSAAQTFDSSSTRQISEVELARIRLIILRAHPQYSDLISSIDGEEPYREWAQSMRELQQQQQQQQAGWEDWERLFDFDLFFGTFSDSGQAWTQGDGLAWPDGDFGL